MYTTHTDKPVQLTVNGYHWSVLRLGSQAGVKKKEIKMTLVQKPINNTMYYTENNEYYTFHTVKSGKDTLWSFACMELGITKVTGLTQNEINKINDLAGTGPDHPTKFLLLKDGKATKVPYLANKNPDLHLNNIILRLVTVTCPHCASKVPPGTSCYACGKPLVA